MAAETTSVAANPNQRPRPSANLSLLTDSTLLRCSTRCGNFPQRIGRRFGEASRSASHRRIGLVKNLRAGRLGVTCERAEVCPADRGGSRLMIRCDLASCADIDISPLRLGNKGVLAITVAQPRPHGVNLCYRPGDGELSPHNNSAHAKAPHASGTTRLAFRDRGTREGAGSLPRVVVAPSRYFRLLRPSAITVSSLRQFISAG